MTKSNILISGALGYIGSAFIEQYSQKYNIFGLDNKFFDSNKETEKKLKNLIYKDIRDINSNDLKGIDIIVHMSELSNDPMGEVNATVTEDININGTLNLVSAADKSEIKKFIYMSSCSVYGFNEGGKANEESILNPLTEYAKAKVANEKFLLYHKSNYQVKILRNATAFGFSPNHRLDLVVNDLVYNALISNSINLLSDGSPIRPIVHIKDISKTISHIIDYDENENLLINVGSNEMNFTIKEIALKISELTGIKNISFGNSEGDKRSYEVDFTYLKEKLPNLTLDFTLEKGILELIKNYKVFQPSENNVRLLKLKYLIENEKISEKFRFKGLY